jgi:hypothetical protein
MNIRSIKARLRRIERLSGGAEVYDQFFASLTSEQLDALLRLLWAAIEASEAGEELSDDNAQSILMDILDCQGREAAYLWRGLIDLPPHPELRRLSEAELDEVINQARQLGNQMEASFQDEKA